MLFRKFSEITSLLVLSMCVLPMVTPCNLTTSTYAVEENTQDESVFDYQELQFTLINNELYVSGLAEKYKNTDDFLEIYIPRKIIVDNGAEYQVIGFTEYAFERCRNIKSITVPETVQSIPRGCFKDCTYLERVRFDNNQEFSIGDYAFYNCSNLQIRETDFWRNISQLGAYAFYNCSNLIEKSEIVGAVSEEIILSNVESVGEYAFSKSNVKAVLFNTLESVPKGCFEDCTDLLVFVMDNENSTKEWKTIEDYAFRGCTSLKYLNECFEKVENFGEYSFGNCINLFTEKEGIVYLNGVRNIEDYAFYNCKSLKTVQIGDCYQTTYVSTKSFIGTSLFQVDLVNLSLLIGDTNMDNKINVIDVLNLKNFLINSKKLNNEYPQFLRSFLLICEDINHDGNISIIDNLLLKKNILIGSDIL